MNGSLISGFGLCGTIKGKAVTASSSCSTPKNLSVQSTRKIEVMAFTVSVRGHSHIACEAMDSAMIISFGTVPPLCTYPSSKVPDYTFEIFSFQYCS